MKKQSVETLCHQNPCELSQQIYALGYEATSSQVQYILHTHTCTSYILHVFHVQMAMNLEMLFFQLLELK